MSHTQHPTLLTTLLSLPVLGFLGSSLLADEYHFDDGDINGADSGNDHGVDNLWSTAGNWRPDGAGTVDTLPGVLDLAVISYNTGTNNDGTETAITSFPAAGVGSAVLINGGDSFAVHSVRIGGNEGLGFGGPGRLENSGGTLTVTNGAGGTGNNFFLGNGGDRSGVYIQTAGTLKMNRAAGTTGHAIIVGNSNGEGFFGLSGGTVNADVTGMRLAESAASQGSYVQDGGTLNVSGGNFETAQNGVGVATINNGNLNVTTNNLIVGKNDSSATFTVNGGTVDLQNRLNVANNASTGDYVQTGGTVNVGTIFAMNDHASLAGTASADISGGILNISDRANGGWLIGRSGNAASIADATVSGTAVVNVLRTGVRVADFRANAQGSLTQTGGTINVSGGNTETAANGTGSITLSGGNYNQLTNNVIVGQASSSDATLTVDGGNVDIENQLRLGNNAATGAYVQTDGTVNVGTTFAMADHGTLAATTTADISGGTLNISDRANGGWLIGRSGGAGSTADVTVAGTAEVNVLRTGIRIADARANAEGSLTQTGGTINVTTGGIRITNGAGATGSSGELNQSGGVINVTAGNTETADYGTGSINLSGTAEFNQNANNFIVGQQASSNATLTVADDAELNITNLLNINAGTGLILQSGGAVVINQDLNLGNNVNDSTYSISGGSLAVGRNVNSRGGTGVDAIEVLGSTPVIDVDNNFNWTNGTTELSYILDATGVAPINVINGVNLAGTLNIDGTALTADLARDEAIVLIDNANADAISGLFGNYAEGDLVFSSNFDLFYLTYQYDSTTDSLGIGNDLALIAIPEPSRALLLLLGGIGCLVRRRR